MVRPAAPAIAPLPETVKLLVLLSNRTLPGLTVVLSTTVMGLAPLNASANTTFAPSAYAAAPLPLYQLALLLSQTPLPVAHVNWLAPLEGTSRSIVLLPVLSTKAHPLTPGIVTLRK